MNIVGKCDILRWRFIWILLLVLWGGVFVYRVSHSLDREFGRILKGECTTEMGELPIIAMTRIGWFSTDPNRSSSCRTTFSKYFVDGVLNHARYTTETVQSLARSNTPTYIFFDVETAGETNWPFYGMHNKNFDRENGRPDNCNHYNCSLIQEWYSEWSTRPGNDNMTAVIIDAHGFEPAPNFCVDRSDERVIVAAINFKETKFRKNVDIAMPMMAGNPMRLSHQQRKSIEECDTSPRRFLMSFVGNPITWDVRQKLMTLDNGRDLIIRNRKSSQLIRSESGEVFSFGEWMMHSEFAAAPRGDCLFSYRFAEILSSGSIPVVYADGWVLPFHEIIDYSQIAVVIPEKDYAKTRLILESIPVSTRCQMRINALQAYEKYFQSARHALDGIVDILDRRSTCQK